MVERTYTLLNGDEVMVDFEIVNGREVPVQVYAYADCCQQTHRRLHLVELPDGNPVFRYSTWTDLAWEQVQDLAVSLEVD